MQYRTIGGVAATTDYIPLLWDIALRLRPEGLDRGRLDGGLVRYLLDHRMDSPVGMVRGIDIDGEEYMFSAEIPEVPESEGEVVPARSLQYLTELDAGVRGSISIGFAIDEIYEVEDPPDDVWWYMDADWELLEVSDVTVPADVRAELRAIPRGMLGGEAMEIMARSGVRLGAAAAAKISDIATRQERTMTTTRHHMRGLGTVSAHSRMGEDDHDDEDREGDHDDEGREGDQDSEGREGDQDSEGREGDQDAEDREGEQDAAREADRTQEREAPERRLPPASDSRGRRLPDDQPTPPAHSRSLHRGAIEIADLDLGNYFRAAIDPSRYRSVAKRELAWIDRNADAGLGLGGDEGVAYIPFALLATAGPAARARAAGRQMRGIDEEQYLERFRGQAELAYADIMRQPAAQQRTLTQAATSAGAATSTMVDLMRSIMWLTEQDRAMEMLTVVPGLRGQWQGFYGATNPTVSWPGEGNDLVETTPTFQRLQRLPVTMGMHWSISTAELASADAPVSAMIEAGCEAVFRTQAMRAFLSGNRNAADFDIQANSITGLLNSGIAETTIGGGAGTVAAYTRDAMVDARRRLVAAEVDPMGLGWIVSNPVAAQLEKTRVGGTESIRFVYENGMIDSGAEMVPARSSVHLGKSTGNAGSETAVHNVSVLLQRAAAVALMWGPGIAFNGLQIPGRTKFDFDLQLQANFAMLNPARATVIKTAAA